MVESAVNLRKARRVELEIPVRISRHTDEVSDGNFYISSLTELSTEGAFVSTSAAYQAGAVLDLHFDLPTPNHGDLPVRALGKVTWQAQGQNTPGAVSRSGLGIGVHFVLMQQPEKQAIEKFIESVSSQTPVRRTPRA